MIFTIIADDLTGANDSGVQFAKKGLRSSVIFNIDDLNKEDYNTDVLILDTDSRSVSKELAYSRVFHAATILNEYPLKYIYKKIDSTLRGNIGAEVDGMLDVFKKDFAIIAPALPEIGRTTIDGNHFLNGNPIHKTEIARDPKAPVMESNIQTILTRQSSRKIANITLVDIYKGKDHVHKLLDGFKEKDIELIVIDAKEESDLSLIVKYVVTSPYDVLWTGSAGLAEHLVEQLISRSPSENEIVIKKSELPVIIVAGSLSQVTKHQIEFMKDKENIYQIELNPVSLFDNNERTNEIERVEKIILLKLVNGLDIVLYPGTKQEQIAEANFRGKLLGLDRIEVSNKIADDLGKIVANVIEKVDISGLVLTGGDTSKAVTRKIGAKGMNLIKELEKGIPIGYLIGSNDILAITKAGAFGSNEALFKARNFIRGGAFNE